MWQQNLQKHLISKINIEKIETNNINSIDSDKNEESYNCVDCNKHFYSQYDFECHNKTKIHIERTNVSNSNIENKTQNYINVFSV